MQLSLDPSKNVERLTITLRWDQVKDRQSVMLVAENHGGYILGSSSLDLAGLHAAELLCDLLTDAGNAWFHSDAHGMTVAPAERYRAARSVLRKLRSGTRAPKEWAES